jgi:hypothetical protein
MDTIIIIAFVLFMFWLIWGFNKTQYEKNLQRAKDKKAREEKVKDDDATTTTN